MKINVTNEQAITEAIEAAEGRARTRTLCSHEIEDAVCNAEDKLESMGIAKKYRIGCMVHFIPEKVAKSYGQGARGTYAIAERCATDWFLTYVKRDFCGRKAFGGSSRAVMQLSEDAISHMPTSFEV